MVSNADLTGPENRAPEARGSAGERSTHERAERAEPGARFRVAQKAHEKATKSSKVSRAGTDRWGMVWVCYATETAYPERVTTVRPYGGTRASPGGRKLKYDANDCGCHADGTFGHGYVRGRLAELVDGITTGLGSIDALVVRDSLRGPMPDDAWDEEEALDLLDRVTAEGFCWSFRDGDLLLTAEGNGPWDTPEERAAKRENR